MTYKTQIAAYVTKFNSLKSAFLVQRAGRTVNPVMEDAVALKDELNLVTETIPWMGHQRATYKDAAGKSCRKN